MTGALAGMAMSGKEYWSGGSCGGLMITRDCCFVRATAAVPWWA
jgi:hypothetical protein